jgi:hypothetical protein
MADRPFYARSNGDAHGRRSPPRPPRWVQASGIIAVAVILLIVTLHLTGLVGMGGHP